MSEADWVANWNGRTVRVYEGPTGDDLLAWDFPEHYFPWITECSAGLDFVCTDWRIREDGELDACQVGVCLDDLVERFIDTEDCEDDTEWAKKRRAVAIDALERAIEKLKTEPLRCMVRSSA